MGQKRLLSALSLLQGLSPRWDFVPVSFLVASQLSGMAATMGVCSRGGHTWLCRSSMQSLRWFSCFVSDWAVLGTGSFSRRKTILQGAELLFLLTDGKEI